MPQTKTMNDMTPEERTEYMRQIRKKRTTPGYFATLSKEELSAISKRGGLGKKNADKNIPDGGAPADPEG